MRDDGGLSLEAFACSCSYMAAWPPSANMQEPVTNDASSEARNRTHAAISRGVPGRLSIVCCANSSLKTSWVLPAATARPELGSNGV